MRATENNGQTIIDIFLGEGLDYGDAADPLYASTKANDGPRHTVVNGFSLGPTVTSDPDARLIDLDTDDGVIVEPFTASFNGSITVNVLGASQSRNAYVSAWIDLNANGIFESSEKIAERAFFSDGSRQIVMSAVSRDARTNVPVAVRVRMSSQQGLGPTGIAPDGEVEDYYTTIRRNPYTNPSNFLDVNADGFVSPIDVLQLVNYINTTGGGRLPFPTTLVVPPYLDVDGDGFVSPLDVNTVISFINLRGGGEGEGEGSSAASDDTWISAASLAAPSVEFSKSSNTASVVRQQSSVAGRMKSLDEYLAALPSEIGPTLAVDSLDWNAMMPMIDDDSNSGSDLAVSLAINDLLADWS